MKENFVRRISRFETRQGLVKVGHNSIFSGSSPQNGALHAILRVVGRGEARELGLICNCNFEGSVAPRVNKQNNIVPYKEIDWTFLQHLLKNVDSVIRRDLWKTKLKPSFPGVGTGIYLRRNRTDMKENWDTLP